MLIALQGYLTQCSPAAIEANINNAASGAPSVSVPGDAPKAAALAAPGTALLQVQQQVISEPTNILPPPPPKPQGSRDQTSFEPQRNEIGQIQDALCVTPADGKLARIAGFECSDQGTNKEVPLWSGPWKARSGRVCGIESGRIKAVSLSSAIRDAVAEARNKDGSVRKCSEPSRNFMNRFEVGLYGNPSEKTDAIASLQAAMRKVLGDDAGVPDNGMLDETTRQNDRQGSREKLDVQVPAHQIDFNLYKALENRSCKAQTLINSRVEERSDSLA